MNDEMATVLRAFVDAIDTLGGVKSVGDGVVPVGDEDWFDLGDVYLDACRVLDRHPVLDKDEDTEDDIEEEKVDEDENDDMIGLSSSIDVKLVGCRKVAWGNGNKGEWSGIYEVFKDNTKVGHINVVVENDGRDIAEEVVVENDGRDIAEEVCYADSEELAKTLRESNCFEESPLMSWIHLGMIIGEFDRAIVDDCAYQCYGE